MSLIRIGTCLRLRIRPEKDCFEGLHADWREDDTGSQIDIYSCKNVYFGLKREQSGGILSGC